MQLKKKMNARELVSAVWVIMITFLIGCPIVFMDFKEHDFLKLVLLFLFLFLEFLPMILYVFTVLQPILSPHLFLPWVVVNSLILLFSSILAPLIYMDSPSLPKVLLSLCTSILLIFPILLAITMFLPISAYVKKLAPNYRKQIRNSAAYRRMTGTKTAQEREREIIWRRKEQVRNTVITERDFDQFIFVNKAAQKWKSKLKKKPIDKEEILKDTLDDEEEKLNDMPNVDEKDILVEGNIAVVAELYVEGVTNGEIIHVVPNVEPLLSDMGLSVPATTVYDNGKLVTDV